MAFFSYKKLVEYTLNIFHENIDYSEIRMTDWKKINKICFVFLSCQYKYFYAQRNLHV